MFISSSLLFKVCILAWEEFAESKISKVLGRWVELHLSWRDASQSELDIFGERRTRGGKNIAQT
jgi:hypothetical protein